MVFYDNGLDSDIEKKAWNKPKKKLEMARENMLLYITKGKACERKTRSALREPWRQNNWKALISSVLLLLKKGYLPVFTLKLLCQFLI